VARGESHCRLPPSAPLKPTRIHWVLFGMQGRTLHPSLTAMHRILISVVRCVVLILHAELDVSQTPNIKGCTTRCACSWLKPSHEHEHRITQPLIFVCLVTSHLPLTSAAAALPLWATDVIHVTTDRRAPGHGRDPRKDRQTSSGPRT
jgi:hypothetical protein